MLCGGLKDKPFRPAIVAPAFLLLFGEEIIDPDVFLFDNITSFFLFLALSANESSRGGVKCSLFLVLQTTVADISDLLFFGHFDVFSSFFHGSCFNLLFLSQVFEQRKRIFKIRDDSGYQITHFVSSFGF
jgi:hypothetical protein